MTDYSHLMHDEVDPQDVLSQLSASVDQWRCCKSRVESLEAELKLAKDSFNKVSQETIPNILLQNGLSEIRLADGSKLKVTTEISASVKDIDDFTRFLESRGEAGIVKTTFAFGRLDAGVLRLAQQLLADNLQLYPEHKREIHSMTLKKYIKEVCAIGKDPDDNTINVTDLPESVGVFTYYKTTIK